MWDASAGVAGSSATESCVGYEPPAPTDLAMLATCAGVAQSYEFEDAKLDIFYGYSDSTPGASETHEPITLDPAQCGDARAWHLMTSGQASWGAGWGFHEQTLDYSAWDGIALWARAGEGTTALFGFYINDGISRGETVIDPATGEKACYSDGDDWDLDGKPNLSLPPESLMCSSWGVTVKVDDQWRFILLPWSVWTNSKARISALGLTTADIRVSQILAIPCADLDLTIASLGAYRAIAQP
jgi:hypothetical protein